MGLVYDIFCDDDDNMIDDGDMITFARIMMTEVFW